jgi:FixJ family two-component response regulator
MTAPQNTMVFIIDDDASVRKALSRLLRSAGHACETYPSAQAFLARVPHAGPCCVVLDFRMPGLDGLALQEALAAAGRDDPIIFITGHGDVPTCARAMKAGAVDFLPKPFRDEDLLTAIAKSLDQSRHFCQAREETARIRTLVDRLTPREQEVLEGVIGGRLNKQIAAQLGTCEKTVKVHRGRVMRKMGVVSVAELVRLTEKIRIGPESGADETKVQ